MPFDLTYLLVVLQEDVTYIMSNTKRQRRRNSPPAGVDKYGKNDRDH